MTRHLDNLKEREAKAKNKKSYESPDEIDYSECLD